jgi:hypothetical protein
MWNALRVAIAAAVPAAALLLLASCGTGVEGCAICGRGCGNLAFTIHLSSGATVQTCCPRCALRYLEQEQPDVAQLEVRDFATGRLLDARGAVYVEGSDVHPCSAGHEGPPKDERGCCLATVYDRCLPGAIAFADRSLAEAFAREHGGFLRSLDALAPSAGPALSHIQHPPGS